MMINCWVKAPSDRPTFRELYSNISKYIECIAGYLEMGFNPFLREGSGKPCEDGIRSKESEGVKVNKKRVEGLK